MKKNFLHKLSSVFVLMVLIISLIMPVQALDDAPQGANENKSSEVISDTKEDKLDLNEEEPSLTPTGEREPAKLIVTYEAMPNSMELEVVTINGKEGDLYKVEIKEFDGYVYSHHTEGSGWPPLEGKLEAGESRLYITYSKPTARGMVYLNIREIEGTAVSKRPSKIYIDLYRSDKSGPESLVKSVLVDVSNNNDLYTFDLDEELDIYAAPGNKYVYSAKLRTADNSGEPIEDNFYFDSNIKFNSYPDLAYSFDLYLSEKPDNVVFIFSKIFGNAVDTRRRSLDIAPTSLRPEIDWEPPSKINIEIYEGTKETGTLVDEIEILQEDFYSQTESKKLPNLDENGNDIKYTIYEVPIEGYKPIYDFKDEYVDTHEGIKYAEVRIRNIYATDFTVHKEWENVPSNVTIPDIQLRLMVYYEEIVGSDPQENPIYEGRFIPYHNPNQVNDKDGNLIEDPYNKPVTLKSGETSFTFKGLPKIEVQGYDKYVESIYSFVEVNVPDEYEATYDQQSHPYSTVTNTYKGEVPPIDIPVEKVWDDNNDKEGLRPSSITINLLANGEKVDSITIGKDQDWKHVFVGKPQNEGGQPIEYTITEEDVEFYLADVSGFRITNTRVATKIDIPVEKVWEDNNNAEGLRPSTVTINLLANGVKVDSAIIDVTTGWKHTFYDMPEYKEGALIEYTITEEPVEHYTSKVEGFTVTNTLNEITKIDILVEKVWDDNNNAKGLRPSTITINLFANGERIDSVTIGKDQDWKHVFADLNEYKDNTLIEYTITEEAVDGYTTVIDGFKVTNTLKEDPVIPVDPPVDPELPGTGISSSLLPQIAIGLGLLVLALNKALKKKSYNGQ